MLLKSKASLERVERTLGPSHGLRRIDRRAVKGRFQKVPPVACRTAIAVQSDCHRRLRRSRVLGGHLAQSNRPNQSLAPRRLTLYVNEPTRLAPWPTSCEPSLKAEVCQAETLLVQVDLRVAVRVLEVPERHAPVCHRPGLQVWSPAPRVREPVALLVPKLSSRYVKGPPRPAPWPT